MKIGVALATFNGAQFLREQLNSLLLQTRTPDHVVISDDGSLDGTVAIAEDFIRAAPFRVDLLWGRGQLGPMGNFLRATTACEAEYIAFCDQDDIWLPQKLELCERALETTGSFLIAHAIKKFRNTTPGAVFISSPKMALRTIDGLETPPHEIVPGMCIVVCKELIELALHFKQLWEPRFDVIAKTRPLSIMDHWSHAHDLYFLTTARLLGQLTFIKPVLALHRIHERNYSSGGSGWEQAPEVEQSWGQTHNRGYRLLAAHCEDFADMLEHAVSTPLSSLRREAALKHYRRWSAIWRHRAILYEAQTRFRTRMVSLMETARKGGYRGRYYGGLGFRSFGKDFSNALGVKVG